MIDLVVCEVLLSLRSRLLICSLVRLSGGTVLSHVTWKSTLETRTKSFTSLRGGILLVRGYRMRDRWNILPGLLHDRMGYLLLSAYKSWDAASGTGNVDSGTTEEGLASADDLRTGL
jgi:hypothetical protein